MVRSDGNPLRVVATKMVPESLPLGEATTGQAFAEGEATTGQAFTVGGDKECR
jgi:hypothetical protein